MKNIIVLTLVLGICTFFASKAYLGFHKWKLDRDNPIKMTERRAKLGDEESRAYIGYYHLLTDTELEYTPERKKQALEWMQVYVDNNRWYASNDRKVAMFAYRLGVALQLGMDGIVDIRANDNIRNQKALKYFRIAASKGHAKSKEIVSDILNS